MPFEAGTLKAQIKGTLPGGEIFSWGLSLMAASGAPGVQADVAASVIASSITPSITPELYSLLPASAAYSSVSVYHYGGGAHADAVGYAPIGHNGTGTANPMPNQVAIVVTQETARPGRSYRGRSYIPVLRLNLSADGQVVDSILTAVLTDIATVIGNLKANSGDAGSIKTVVASSKGFNTDLTAISADTRLDIQRRRAESQAINDRVTHVLV